MTLVGLNDMINRVCPIDGLNTNGVIWFKPEATEEQKAQAQKLLDENLPLMEVV